MKSKYFVLTLMALMAIVLATTIQIVADVAASEAVPEMIGANMIGAESADIAAAQTVTPTGVITEGETLKIVKERGTLKCGVNAGVPGFGFLDSETNEFSGFDVDFCRAVAAAVLGDAEAVEFRPATGQDRFPLLQSGEIDMLSRNTTWTFIRDTELGLNFAPTTFYDGQGLMVTEESGIETIENMEGTTVCVQQGTTTEANLADVMRIQGIDYEPVVFEDAPRTLAAYSEGRCDVITADRSALVTERLQLANPEDHLILDEVISKEPLGPLVRHGDDQWFDIVKWTVFATIAAEEYGVTSENVEEMAQTSENPEIRRLLGAEGELGQKLGLENDWAVKVIAQVGNYGEIYDRHLGPDTPINLARGLNVLYTEGGLLYAPPFR
jgi:general L-amino acid transport system substrate-binding protein